MIRYTKEHIDELLSRFMDGTTTLDEEDALREYFSTARDVPEAWRPYQLMFAEWTPTPTTVSGTRARLRKLGAALVATAAAVGLVVISLNSPESLTPNPVAESLTPNPSRGGEGSNMTDGSGVAAALPLPSRGGARGGVCNMTDSHTLANNTVRGDNNTDPTPTPPLHGRGTATAAPEGEASHSNTAPSARNVSTPLSPASGVGGEAPLLPRDYALSAKREQERIRQEFEQALAEVENVQFEAIDASLRAQGYMAVHYEDGTIEYRKKNDNINDYAYEPD